MWERGSDLYERTFVSPLGSLFISGVAEPIATRALSAATFIILPAVICMGAGRALCGRAGSELYLYGRVGSELCGSTGSDLYGSTGSE